MCALSGLEKSRGKATGHMFSAAITLDANLKLIRRNVVLSASSLPAALAKEAYHLALEPAVPGFLVRACRTSRSRSNSVLCMKPQFVL